MKILFAINSDGLGHAVRSIPIIEKLIKEGHHLHILTSKNVKDFYNSKYGEYTLIPQFKFNYADNEIDYWNTFVDNIYKDKGNVKNFKKIIKLIKEYNPDIILSDFERYSLWCGQIMEVPTICIDNQSTIFRGDVEFKLKDFTNFMTLKSIGKILAPHADKYMGLCFYKTKIIKKNTTFFDPIMLEEQYNFKPKKQNYILVYNRFFDKTIMKEIKKIKNQKFIVFGSKKDYKSGNIEFKKMGTPGMWKYIANAKALVTNGGHTSITEAIYFKTPIYSMPVKLQFEQITNALYLQKMKFGEKHDNIDSNQLNNFLLKVDYYKYYLEKHKFEKPNKFFKALNKNMKELILKKKSKKQIELEDIKKIKKIKNKLKDKLKNKIFIKKRTK